MASIEFLDGQEASKFRKAYGTGADDNNAYTIPYTDGISVAVTPTITGGAYSALDAVGGLMEFANMTREAGGLGELETILISDKNLSVNAYLRLWLFKESVSVASDNAAFSISDADMLKCVGWVNIPDINWAAAGASSLAVTPVPRLVFPCTATSLFGQLALPTGSSPTFSSTSDLTVVLVSKYKS